MSDKIEILGIPFTTLFEQEILDIIRQTLIRKDSSALFIATPNPEMILESARNFPFKKVIQSTGLNLPDGNGLIWANDFIQNNLRRKNRLLIAVSGVLSLISFIFRSKNDRKRFKKALHGSDLTMKICTDPEISSHGIFLLGNRDGLRSDTALLTARKLGKINPAIQIAGSYDGRPNQPDLIEKINHSGAEILLVAFGAPVQELWIAENLSQMPQVKVAMGIGGTFDFIAGTIPRAPEIMRKTGFEWLYRLYRQPKRIARIFRAVFVFPYLIIKNRLANPRKGNI
jgi:N-acetylglucosaminyldiphosphoundecaprenol N-acetyl-beta-D-mannosaminyltransferase